MENNGDRTQGQRPDFIGSKNQIGITLLAHLDLVPNEVSANEYNRETHENREELRAGLGQLFHKISNVSLLLAVCECLVSAHYIT